MANRQSSTRRSPKANRGAPKPSRALVLINRKSGTVRSRGAEAVKELVEEKLGKAFSRLDVELIEGDATRRIEHARDSGEYDVIIAGGGDGTISSTAGLLSGTNIILGALPLGTMNLFVQALGFSPRLDGALDQLAAAHVEAIDVGTVNGRVFLHQVSFGLQPRMARIRERMGYSSRLTKMFTGFRALLIVAANPKLVRVRVDADGAAQKVKAPLLIVSNNPLGAKSNVSLPQTLSSGQLGYYILTEFSFRMLFRLARDYLANRFDANEAIEKRTVTALTIKKRSRNRLRRRKKLKILSSIDGEIVHLDNPVSFTISP
ncbi:MAG: diacylglycerol/lipid kinase family protein, partial [Aestuariivirga sp.]